MNEAGVYHFLNIPSFVKDKYIKNEITIKDLLNVSEKGIYELKKAELESHSNLSYNQIYLIGISNLIKLYKHSKDLYELLSWVMLDENISFESALTYENFPYNEIQKAIEENNYDFIKEYSLKVGIDLAFMKNADLSDSNIYPKMFVDEYRDCFYLNDNLPDNFNKRYYKRELLIEDVLNNIKYIDNPYIYQFIKKDDSDEYLEFDDFARKFKNEDFFYLLKNYTSTIKYLVTKNACNIFSMYIVKRKSADETFREAVKAFISDNYSFIDIYHEKLSIFKLNWLNEMGFNAIQRIENEYDLCKIDENTIVFNFTQMYFIQKLGLKNLQIFENEYKFFSTLKALNHYDYMDLSTWLIRNKDYFHDIDFYKLVDSNFDYDEFEKLFAQILNISRFKGYFKKSGYDFLKGDFRLRHPEIFISKDAPDELKKSFYNNGYMHLQNLKEKIEYVKYLKNTNLNYLFMHPTSASLKDTNETYNINFIDYYTEKFGNEAFLNLAVTYGGLIQHISYTIFDFDNKDNIDKKVRKSIYNYRLKEATYNYWGYLKDLGTIESKKFISEYPDLFLSEDEFPIDNDELKHKIINKFYKRNLKPTDIYNNKELVNYLKNKNLKYAFEVPYHFGMDDIIKEYGNEFILSLFVKYGRYIEEVNMPNILKCVKSKDYYDICLEIEKRIIGRCRDGFTNYTSGYTLPFIKYKCPDLFLEDDAPSKLKVAFYNGIEFFQIQNHKDWIPYLKGKDLYASLAKKSHSKDELSRFFLAFNEDERFDLISKKASSVETMINTNNVELLYKWYCKTNKKFIPHAEVMINLSSDDDIDKFLKNASWWSKLTKNSRYANTEEHREALVKLAYSFGIFDGDSSGYKKLNDFLYGVPRKLNNISMLETYLDTEYSIYLENAMIEEGLTASLNEDLLEKLYKKDSDGTYRLIINERDYPNTYKELREYMELLHNSTLITPNKAHQLFGNFKITYDKDFREFLLDNIEDIMTNHEYGSYIGTIQRRFDEIKMVNANRKLTLKLAVDFVKTNKYEGVIVGNERLAETCSIAGYSQENFNTLQEIYEYGKKRVYSSIPRVEGKCNDYKYEILRLDDPLALAIGTLTNCCQEIGDAAEVSMEHSMTSIDGRVFVIKDKDGSIVSQSWVWRNADTICFDNIEIPDKVFDRVDESKSEVATNIYKIYKDAAKKLIDEDNKKYKDLLNKKLINIDDYNKLKLNKVTVGLGYNDIASVIQMHAKKDDGVLKRPLAYKPPVKLEHDLYTSDSNVQYILEEYEHKISNDVPRFVYSDSDVVINNGKTLSVYADDYVVYNNDTISKKLLKSLANLERKTKQCEEYELLTNVDDRIDIIRELSENYDFDNNVNIIINSNFAIIFEDNIGEIIIGDIFYTSLEKHVLIQLKHALEQISNGKNIDVSNLNDTSLNAYNKFINIDIDEELKHNINTKR